MDRIYVGDAVRFDRVVVLALPSIAAARKAICLRACGFRAIASHTSLALIGPLPYTIVYISECALRLCAAPSVLPRIRV